MGCLFACSGFTPLSEGWTSSGQGVVWFWEIFGEWDGCNVLGVRGVCGL